MTDFEVLTVRTQISRHVLNKSKTTITPSKALELLKPLVPSITQRKRTAHAGQRKLDAAILLHELARTRGYDALGFNSLPALASKLGIKQDVLKKYRQAAEVLQRRNPALYRQAVVSIRDNTPRPELPLISALVILPSIERRMGAALGPEVVDNLLSGKRTHIRSVSHLADNNAYGESDDEGKGLLRTMDLFLSSLPALEQTLATLNRGAHWSISPATLLERRLNGLLAATERLRRLCEDILPTAGST